MEYLPDFELLKPTSVKEAVRLKAKRDGARYVAGGTDLIVNARRGIEIPQALIDVTGIEELTDIGDDDDGVTIGAAVPLAAVAADERVARQYRAVAEAAVAVAGPTHREYGTLGGNLCLDTRCLYYNQSEWWRRANDYCLKERGSVCHVAPSGDFCFAAFSGDVAPAMLVHRAEVTLAGPRGRRRIPLAELYKDDGRDHLALKAGELLVAAHLPRATAGMPSAYAKARIRGAIDFPLAGVAVGLRMDGGAVAELTVALTAVAPRPFVVAGTAALAGRPLDDGALDRLRDIVRNEARPMHTTTTTPWYRRRVVGNLARRLAARLA